MKKIILWVLMIVAIFSFAACANEDESDTRVTVLPTLSVDTEATGVVQESATAEKKAVTIGEKEYEFPVLVSDLIDDGWYFDDSVQTRLDTVEANTIAALPDISLYHNEYQFRIVLIEVNNDSDAEKPVRDCKLIKVGVNGSAAVDASKIKFVLPGGITWQSTAADVVSVYGTAENHPEYFSKVKHMGSTADYTGDLFSVSFTFFEDGTIEYICFS